MMHNNMSVVDEQKSNHAAERDLTLLNNDRLFFIKNGNRLISTLNEREWDRWKSKIEVVQLKNGSTLLEAGQSIQHVYFPISGVVSQLYEFEDGKSAEIVQMGNEGLVGIYAFTGNSIAASKSTVIADGVAYRWSADWLQNEFNQSTSFRCMILKYLQVLMTYTSQSAICNRRHSIKQQLSRNLLSQLDRVAGDHLALTHELISRSIGVRREGVSEAAKKLERQGAITYSRGQIKVLNRQPLFLNTCECYGIIRNEQKRLFPDFA
jgi:CRP-like cAMP-binding protein